MNFTDEHKRILDKNEHYYKGLKENGTLNKCSSVIVAEFQKVYSEVVSDKTFSIWCPACIIELIELVYANYNNYKNDNRQEARPEQTREQSRISTPESKGTTLQNGGGNEKQDRRILRRVKK